MQESGSTPPSGPREPAPQPSRPGADTSPAQGYPVGPPPAAPSAGHGAPPSSAPSDAPGAQAPTTGYAPYPSPGPAPAKSGSGWKWFAIAMVVLALAVFGCCIVSVFSFAPMDSGTTFGDSIVVIHLDGVIAGTGSRVDGYITPEAMFDQLDRAAADSNVKAILVRVDSPGGTVAASQEIATEIARVDKPVVVSVGDVDASGAYMISSQADLIVASPTSTVGSIGVIAEIPNLAGLLEKVGVEFTVLTAGEFKDAGSPWRSITETETALIQEEIDFAYEEFIRIVAEGRELPESRVREMATGWAWSGAEAMEMGLVDELGTYNDALDHAADLGGIDGDYEIVSYEEYDYTDLLLSLIGIKDTLGRIGAVSDVDVSQPAIPR